MLFGMGRQVGAERAAARARALSAACAGRIGQGTGCQAGLAASRCGRAAAGRLRAAGTVPWPVAAAGGGQGTDRGHSLCCSPAVLEAPPPLLPAEAIRDPSGDNMEDRGWPRRGTNM